MKVAHYLHQYEELREEEVEDHLVIGQEGQYFSPDCWTEEDESVPRWEIVDLSKIFLDNGILIQVDGIAYGGKVLSAVPIREDFFGDPQS